MTFIMLINVKMSTISKNDKYIILEVSKQEMSIFQHFSSYEQMKYHAQLSWAWENVIG